jgi:hypothetical protein
MWSVDDGGHDISAFPRCVTRHIVSKRCVGVGVSDGVAIVCGQARRDSRLARVRQYWRANGLKPSTVAV